ncbi:MAG: 2-amino-4-hydroxy-6-hydroxymethyldihydropteridine diphosphokinase [Verrucomicrobiota bacterium]|jgi:2-amino-4-hydroxy-6-hydroxymethyldihydropteridine diphosphokinase
MGSNLGDRLANLRAARTAIESLDRVRPLLLASAVYETEPVGCAPDTAKFLNAVIEIEYAGDARHLLHELVEIETRLGRPAFHARNASRTLDLDLLYFGDTLIETPELQLPHPRIAEREFVLRPLADITPDLILPHQTESTRDLLLKLPKGPPVVRIASEW